MAEPLFKLTDNAKDQFQPAPDPTAYAIPPEARPKVTRIDNSAKYGDFVPNPYSVIGSQDNHALIHGLNSTPEGISLLQTAQMALQEKDDYEKQVKSYSARQTNLNQGTDSFTSLVGAMANLDPQGDTDPSNIFDPKAKTPSEAVSPRSAYGQFLTKFGSTPANIVTGVITAQDRAKHIASRISNTDEYKALVDPVSGDPSLLERPDELIKELRRNKLFNNEDEVTFTKEGVDSQFGSRAGISTIDNLREMNPSYDRSKDPKTRYEAFMSGELRLNPFSPEDRAEVKKLLEWRNQNPDNNNFGKRFYDTTAMLGRAIGNTVSGAVDTVGHPKIDWNPDYKDDDAKRKFTSTLLQLAQAQKEGGDMTGFSLPEAIDMAERNQSRNGQSNSDMIIGKRSAADSHELVLSANAQYEEIKKNNGFSGAGTHFEAVGGHYVGGGLQSLFTLTSAAASGLVPMMSMAFGNDVPGQTWYSPITTAKNNLSAAVNSIGSGLDGGYDKDTYDRWLYTAIISNMNTNHAINHFAIDRTKSGFLPDGYGIDPKWHQDASMWVTPSMLKGAVTGSWNIALQTSASQTMFPSLSRTAIGSINASARTAIDASKVAMLASLEELKGAGMLDKMRDPGAVALLKQVKDAAVAAGEEPLSDAEAIKRAFSGEAKMPDPRDPSKLIAIPPETLQGLAEAVNEHVKTVQTLSEQIEAARVASLGITYTDRSLETIAKMRAALKISEPGIDWDKMNDAALYTRIQKGRIPLNEKGVAAISTNEARAIQQEVGNVFRRIDTKDLTGFQEGQALPFSTGYIGSAIGASLNVVSKTFQKLREGNRWAKDAADLYGDPTVAPITISRVGLISGENINATAVSAAGNAAVAGAMHMKSVGWFSELLGSAGDKIEVFNDYLTNNNLSIGQSYGSTFEGMKRNYFAQMNQNLIRQRAIDQNFMAWAEGAEARAARGETAMLEMPESIGTSVPLGEVRKLQIEFQKLSDKVRLTQRLDTFGRNGAFSDMTRMLANGTISCTTNEIFMAGLTDFNSLGAGTAYGMMGTGINALHQGFARQFTTAGSLRARTNQAMVQIQGATAAFGPGEIADVQRKTWLDLQMGERDKANKMAMDPKYGQLAGEVYFGRSMSIMSQLLQSGAAIEFHDKDVIQGAMSMVRQINNSGVETAPALLKEYLKEAALKGITGQEATDYAQQMVNQWHEAQNSSIAAGEYEKSIAALRTEQAKIALGNGNMLSQQSQIVEQMAKELGLDPAKLFSSDGSLVAGVDLSKLDPKIRTKIETFIDKAKDIKEKNSASIARQAQIDSEVAEIVSKKAKLPKSEFAQFREGETLVSDATDERWTSVKNGVTIYEKDGKTTIMMPSNNWDAETAQEEFAHVLIRTTNARDSLPALRNALFGTISVDELGKRIQTVKPSIADTPENAIKLIDKFVDAHSQTLSTGDAVAFRGQWDLAKKAFNKNPNDIKRMDSVLLELSAKIYQASQALSNPHSMKYAGAPGSPSGSLETTPITTPEGSRAGDPSLKGIAKMFLKIAGGDMTVMDFVNDGRQINNLAVDLSPSVSEQDVKNGMQFLAYFGKNGTLQKMWDSMTISKLQDMGFDWTGDTSVKDYRKFWTYGKIRDINTGELVDMHPDLISWAKQLQIHTRNIGGEVCPYTPWDVADILAKQDSSTDADSQARWQWALSSGRQKWLNPTTGKFINDLRILMGNEAKPLKNLANRIIAKEVGFDGETIGLYPKASANGDTVLFGAPNKQQAAKILAYLEKDTAEFSEGSRANLDNMATLLTAIANGNIFDPAVQKGGVPGWTSVFFGEYNPASQSKGLGTDARVKTPGLSPKQVAIVPLGIELRTSGLNTEGRKSTPEEIAQYGETHLYFHMLDVNSLQQRIWNSWHGNVWDRTGEKYWGPRAMYEMFGSQKNFREAIEEVLQNYQNGGHPINKPPPYHSWEVLLDRFNGDVNRAQKAASTINRVLGFTQTPYQEMTGLEVIKERQNGRLNAHRDAALEALQEEFYNPEEAAASEKRRINLISKANVELARKYAENPNTVGLNPIRDDQMPLKTYRADRFIGDVTPARGASGSEVKVPWNQFTASLGNVNYSSNNWTPLELWSNMSNIQKNYDIGSTKAITAVWTHSSGYTLMQLGVPAVERVNGEATKMVIFNPQNKLIDSTGVKGLDDALLVAQAHAENNLQRPVVGNVMEESLAKNGWLPGSAVFAAKIRDTFVSTDGNWKIERKGTGSGMYDLTDLNSGYILAKGIRIGMGKDGTPDLNGLNSAVKSLQDSGQVSIALSKKFQADIVGTHPRLPEYNVVREADGSKSKAFFAANPAYYEIKQRIAETIGFDKAEEITSKMRAELGDDVIKHQPDKVFEWMNNWHKQFTVDATNQNLADGDPVKQKEMRDLQNATEIMQSIAQGEKLKGALPPKPANPGAKASDNDAAAYREEMIKYTEAQKAHGDYIASLDWAGFDLKGLANLGQWLNGLKARQEEYARTAAFAVSNTDVANPDNPLGQEVLDNVSKIKNMVRTTNVATQSNWFLEKSGMIIQEMLSKNPKPIFGTEYTHKRITVLGKEPEGAKDAKYIVYSLGGNIVAQAATLEEANDIVFRATNKSSDISWLSNYKDSARKTKNTGPAPTTPAPTPPAPAQDTGNSKPKATTVAPAPNRYTTPAPR